MADLDLDEMFHLAMVASQNGDHERAIVLLKQGAETEKSARFYYLLGAEHAEIGMTARAISDIERALELDPSIADAWFQLGLLHAVHGDRESAERVWLKLDEFGEYAHLAKFRDALITYFDGGYEAAITLLQEGVESNSINEALNADMSALLNRWIEELESSINETKGESESNHLYLSAYTKKH